MIKTRRSPLDERPDTRTHATGVPGRVVGRVYTVHTGPMKVAISVPDALYEEADQLATQLGWSRSRLYSRAVEEFLQRRQEDPVTAALNELAEYMDPPPPPAGHWLIESGRWEW